jgi:sarcosine oxidase, subunit beta
MQTADLASIGGGVIGCSIAYHLAQIGVTNVVVFEGKRIASGATGICPGGIRQQFEGEAECILAQRSMRFFERVNEFLEPEMPFVFERTGYLFLAESEEQLGRFRQNVEMQNRLGIPSRVVDSDQIQAIVPAMARDGILGGSFCAEDGFLEDCDGVTNRLLRCARDRGARLEFESITHIEAQNERWELATESRRWTVGKVVLAAGVDTAALARTAGLELPIRAERRRLAYTESLPERVLPPLVVAFGRSFAGKQLSNGVFYLGWLGETSDSDDLTFVERALSGGETLFPMLAELPVRRVIAGYYDLTPDARPILGSVPGFNGLYLAAGFSGHGFMMAPAVGEILARLVAGGEADPLLEHFSLMRFAAERRAEGLQI